MISEKEVKKVAKLARIDLTKKEIKKFQKELSQILDYIEKLKEVDISKIEPTSHPFLLKNVMREDKVKRESIERINKLMKAVPKKERGYVRVKVVL
jgi:aspartyl-tRNA(Asn)/glutamyl-tRNA(Gln) amidotransferase subunit C